MNMKISVLITALTAVVSLSAGQHKLSNDLAGLDRNSAVNVIVQYRTTPTTEHHERMARRGATLRRELSVIKGALYSVPASALQDLASDPEVSYISPDRAVHGSLDYAEPAIGALTAYNNGINGLGVGVALIDSGVSYHDDLGLVPGQRSSRASVRRRMGMDMVNTWPASSRAMRPIRPGRTTRTRSAASRLFPT
jgi:subtilisin family serine protease